MTISRRRLSSLALLVCACMLALVPATGASARPGKRAGQVKTVRYGPFTVPANGGMMADGMMGRMLSRGLTNIAKPCDGCSITGMRANLTYADGKTANFDTGIMLHHVVLSNRAEKDLTCPTRGQRFFASGNERTPLALPRKYGYPVNGSDRWNALVDLMNMSPRAQTVYVDVTYRIRRGRTRPATPVWLDATGCGNSRYAIPAGRSVASREWKSPADYRVLTIGGHLHDYGRYIQLSDVTRATRICRSVAGFGRNPSYMGHIESMTTCPARRKGRGRNGKVVRAGDTLRLDAVYKSPQARDDVMGIMLGYVAPLLRR